MKITLEALKAEAELGLDEPSLSIRMDLVKYGWSILEVWKYWDNIKSKLK